MGYYPTSDAMDWVTDDDCGREISGRGGNDRFYSAAGKDVLIGGSGRDTLYGQVGDDALHGGDHDERFPVAPAGICSMATAETTVFSAAA